LREFNKIVSCSSNVISGDDAFILHDTLGFSIEITKELAHMHGLTIDEERLKERFEEHRARSRGKT